MFDLGFSEILLVMALAVLVLGPNEIPKVMMTLGRVVRRLQYVRYAFSQQFEEFLRENDLEDIRKQVNFEEKQFDEFAADEEEEIPEPLRALESPKEKSGESHG